jgi:Na+-driven multidrug efflux pump
VNSAEEIDHHLLEYATSIIFTLAFAVFYGVLEYYWIVTNKDVPFRYGHGPIFLGFYDYHIFVMFPILLIVGFSPLIADILGTGNKVREKSYTAALGVATTLFSIMLEDITWFFCRTIHPLPLDTLAGKWIQPSDWTARGPIGYLSIPGGVIPSWYIIVAFVTVLIWAAVFKHWSLFARPEPYPRYEARSPVILWLLASVATVLGFVWYRARKKRLKSEG